MKEIVSIKGKRKLLRFYRISLIILASIVLSGCELSSPSSGSSESPFSSFSSSDIYPIQSYTVTWENYDGTILEIDTDVLKGANPSYDGDTPTKKASASQVYNFKGWSPALTPVTSNITYTAQFKSELKKYTISWHNYDNSLLSSDLCEYGSTPIYFGTTPTKPETETYSYSFKGWTPEVVPVLGDADYVATFEETKKAYTVTWLDYDRTSLEVDQAEYGTMPQYHGITPFRLDEEGYKFTFDGWDKELSPVISDVTYTATYASEVAYYSIVWTNYDNSVLETDTGLKYGDTPSFGGDTPIKPATSASTYIFSGWSPTVHSVTGNQTYTAQFLSTTNKYIVTWKNYDGSVLYTDRCDYGTKPVYGGATPTMPRGHFTGWSPTVSYIFEDTTYVAQFEIDYVIDDLVVTDNVYFKLTFNAVVKDLFLKMTYTLVNKTTSKINVSSYDVYINGYAASMFIYESLDSNATVSGEAYLTQNEILENYPVDEIVFGLKVTNSSYSTVYNQTFSAYPTGLCKSDIVYPERITTNTECSIVENDSYKIVYLNHEFSSFLYPTVELNLYFECTGTLDYEFTFENLKVNDVSINNYDSVILDSGYRAYDSVDPGGYSINQAGISTIQTVEFDIGAKDETKGILDNPTLISHIEFFQNNGVWGITASAL